MHVSLRGEKEWPCRYIRCKAVVLSLECLGTLERSRIVYGDSREIVVEGCCRGLLNRNLDVRVVVSGGQIRVGKLRLVVRPNLLAWLSSAYCLLHWIHGPKWKVVMRSVETAISSKG